MLHPSRRATILLGRFLTGAALATVVGTGLPAPATAPAPPEVKIETVDLTPRAAAAVGSAERRVAAVPGWSTRARPSLSPQLVGFRWDGAPRGAVQVRARSGGSWGAWYDVDAEADEAPDADSPEAGHGTTSAGPVWLGDGVRDVEVKVEHGHLRNLRMDAIRSVEHGPSGFGIAGAGALPGRPGIISRAAWGAEGWATGNAGCGAGPRYTTGAFGVVHHTVNGNTYGPDQSDDLLRGIQAFHVHTNGWCDIAYNFLVDRFGRVFEGRAGGVQRTPLGGHTKGFNVGAIGVSLLGDYTQVGVSPATLAGLRSILSWKFALHGIDAGDTTVEVSGGSTRYPEGAVVRLPRLFGHRDVSLTSCPGGFAYPLLPALRRDVQTDVVTSLPAPLPRWTPAPSGPGVLVLDAYGGLNPGGHAGAVSHSAHWPGFATAPRGRGYVVDGYGGIHPYGGAGGVRGSAYWPGRDLARGITRSGRGSGWVVDAYGGLHPYGSAPTVRGSFYAGGWDIVRGVAARPRGGGGYVLDGWGGVHPFGGAPRVRQPAYWRGWDIARGIAMRPDGRGGYLLDGYGGVHPFGGAPRLRTSLYARADRARGLVLMGTGSTGYVVDVDGHLWPVGDAPIAASSRGWVGRNLTRGVVAA